MDGDEGEASGDEEEDGDEEDGDEEEEEDGPSAGMKLAACSVDFNVGFFSDRESGFEGISHFLEHMVFMGSEKYPGEVVVHLPVHSPTPRTVVKPRLPPFVPPLSSSASHTSLTIASTTTCLLDCVLSYKPRVYRTGCHKVNPPCREL